MQGAAKIPFPKTAQHEGEEKVEEEVVVVAVVAIANVVFKSFGIVVNHHRSGRARSSDTGRHFFGSRSTTARGL